MPTKLDPIRPFKCTFENCYESFNTEKEMKNHKRYSDEHEYCHKCDEDFADFELFAYHKVIRPEKHGKACRVCGDEFKSSEGLKRHIELNHSIDQKLTCFGCQRSFCSATLFIEHLEFGKCRVITASQFQGHIVHKYLITEYLKNGDAYARFQQKQAKYEAALDCEEEGGVNLDGDVFDDGHIDEVQFQALKPDMPCGAPLSEDSGRYPPLPGHKKNPGSSLYDLTPALSQISLHGNSTSDNAVIHGSTTAFTNAQPKAWGARDGKSTSSILFPGAKPTPATSEFSIAAHDNMAEQERNLNIMRTHFWDPTSIDYDPYRFYDVIDGKYYCPFVCEQSFDSVSDVKRHISDDHRITRMKCPLCLKYFNSATALMAHCETRGARCEISKADDFNIFLDRLSGGFLNVEEKARPDHYKNPTILMTNEDTGRLERYKPPVASYLEYMVTKPPEWKEPVSMTVVGGIPAAERDGMRW